jgi:hypothetical protein
VKLHKKGDVTNCENWRGITLLSVPSKIISWIILNQVKIYIEKTLRKEQAGYQSKRSCIDKINTLRVIIEQSMEYVTNLYLLFVDFEKAFDSLNRNKMWNTMRKYDTAGHIINIIKQTYERAPPLPVPSQDKKGGGGGVTTSLIVT